MSEFKFIGELALMEMKVEPLDYFPYTIFGLIFFFLGLRIFKWDFKYPRINISNKTNSVELTLFAIGLFFYLLPTVENSFSFIFFILRNLMQAAVFFSLFKGGRYTKYLMIFSLVLLVTNSLRTAMFGELMSWLLFYVIAIIGYNKPKKSAAYFMIILLFFVIVIVQFSKLTYRQAVNSGDAVGGIESFVNSTETEAEGSERRIAEALVRFNQGYFLAAVLNTVPEKVDFQNGNHTTLILEAVFFPRFLVTNKLISGNSSVTSKYTNKPIKEGTSMSIGLLGDSYIDYGFYFGILLCFFYGFIFSMFLFFFNKMTKGNSILVHFVPLLIYYSIRPDNDTHTALGFMFKSLVLLYILQRLLFKIYNTKIINKKHDYLRS